MRKCLILSVVLLSGCGSRILTESSDIPEKSAMVQSAGVVPEQITDMGPDWTARFFTGAGFEIGNYSGIGQSYRAYVTSFDNQNVELAHKDSGTIRYNETWGGSFNMTCVQLDITQNGPSGKPLVFAYFDKAGKEFDPHDAARMAACRQPAPTPKPVCSPGTNCQSN